MALCYGIKTGLNEAFVINSEKRNQLIDEHSSSRELIKPWLQGREIKRWRGEPSGLHVIVVRYGYKKPARSIIKKAGSVSGVELVSV